MPDATDNTTKTTNWVEGAPVKKWYGLKVRGKRKLMVETWRCARCGFLENYAPA